MKVSAARYLLEIAQLAAATVAVVLVVGWGVSVWALAVIVIGFALVLLNVRLFGGTRDPFICQLVSSFRKDL